MSSSDANSLRRQIGESETRLAELDTERAATERRLSELQAKLAEIEPSAAGSPVPSPAQPPRSKNEKLALFRTLFAGRADVFPRLWLMSIAVSIGGCSLPSEDQEGERVAREIQCLQGFLSRML